MWAYSTDKNGGDIKESPPECQGVILFMYLWYDLHHAAHKGS